MNVVTCIWRNWPVCAIVCATTYKKGGGFGASNTYAARLPTRKGGCMLLLKRTMSRAWWQDVGVYFSRFYGKIERSLTTPYKATAARAVNTERLSIPVPDKED